MLKQTTLNEFGRLLNILANPGEHSKVIKEFEDRSAALEAKSSELEEKEKQLKVREEAAKRIIDSKNDIESRLSQQVQAFERVKIDVQDRAKVQAVIAEEQKNNQQRLEEALAKVSNQEKYLETAIAKLKKDQGDFETRAAELQSKENDLAARMEKLKNIVSPAVKS